MTGFYIGRYTGDMTKALRGLNLGGWLVAERWMTPSLFEGVVASGEAALVRELGVEEARRRLTAHRGTFITKKDFKWIAEAGFDFVRLPVGYWLFAETDDFIDGEIYLRQAFDWAKEHDLQVILDFHGLQGSQNGQDHSGQVGKIKFYRRGNRGDALQTLEYMAKMYGRHPALLGIEIINEPKVRWLLWRLLRYYDRAIPLIKPNLASNVKIIVSDAFKPLKMARVLSRRSYAQHIVMDIHLYQVFGKQEQSMSVDQHLRVVRHDWSQLLTEIGSYMPIIVGEWSAGLPGAADREGRADEYFQAQHDTFSAEAWAHCYWSYKAPGAGVWDYRTGIYPRIK